MNKIPQPEELYFWQASDSVSLVLACLRSSTGRELILKKIIIAAGFAVISTAASAQGYGSGTGSNPNSHSVQGYTRSNGNQATNPDSTQGNNYGTSGNFNPYNGSTGHRGARN